MSTYTSEPGTRLAGRYRLVDQVSSGTGWTYWKATDETLARSVTVLTFATGFPRVTETVTAARAASRLGDPRFAQVFDVEDGEELAYVVLEWVGVESLLDMLSEGPLDPPRAAAMMVEAARAIAAAHAIGLAQLRLDPACVHWTVGGGVKIAGLGIDAALAGPALTASEDGADDPELTDTRDLARLLYAALTGYWPGLPGADGSAPAPPPPAARPALLPPAPENGSGLCTPRHVSAGVPGGGRAAHAGQRDRLQPPRQQRRRRPRRRAEGDRRQSQHVLAHQLLPRPPVRESEEGHRADPGHGPVGAAEPADGSVRHQLLHPRHDRGRQQQHGQRRDAEHVHRGAELERGPGQHHLQRDQAGHRSLRADMDHRFATAGRQLGQVRDADLRRNCARLRLGPAGLMRHAGRGFAR